jgi:hypothetical protein
MLSKLHSTNLKLGSKQYNIILHLHLIVSPQLSSGWRHNYSTKTRQAGSAVEQSMYSLMSLMPSHSELFYLFQHFYGGKAPGKRATVAGQK